MNWTDEYLPQFKTTLPLKKRRRWIEQWVINSFDLLYQSNLSPTKLTFNTTWQLRPYLECWKVSQVLRGKLTCSMWISCILNAPLYMSWLYEKKMASSFSKSKHHYCKISHQDGRLGQNKLAPEVTTFCPQSILYNLYRQQFADSSNWTCTISQ